MALDIALPDFSCFDLQQPVADRREIRVIFLTGDGDVATSVQADSLPALVRMAARLDIPAARSAEPRAQ